jgi:tRNA(fMet)-specific endonuclease VapC
VIYFLDTNVVIALIKGTLVVREHLRRAIQERATVAISSLVFFELWYGAAKSERRRETTERLRLFLSADIAVVPFEEDDAAAAGDLRASLEAKGTPIGPYDLLIAAHALRVGATVVTANVSEFARVSGLIVEDWTK